MDFHHVLLGFVEIVKETYKIFSNNGKLIPFITLLFLLLHSIIFLSNFFAIRPFLKDLAVRLFSSLLAISSPTSTSSDFTKFFIVIKDDAGIIAGLEFIFLFSTSLASLFFAAATIIASAATFGGKALYLKDLLSKVWKSWKRAFVTVFYIALLDLGYSIFALSFMIPIVLIMGIEYINLATYITVIVASIFYGYLSIVWNLAIVVSVLEEKCGIESLGKAGRLVKGMKLEGFLLNLVFGIVYYSVFQFYRMINGNQSEAVIVIVALLYLDFLRLVKMFSTVAYTVLYCKCKKSHGEEIELQENFEYVKVPSTNAPLTAADIP
ncbi:hypothetical protein FNV43_RR03284 [Rhamnella rubrinervis]|uniref:Transmembrane protein n=1 Tax=Rhamnella rubrinervis TaxID=2594499 RepID=A0A8K0HHG4_9ROSA|nr:hypothetical protein FNV43_RR03284 [Rhamnella rubrinervis]